MHTSREIAEAMIAKLAPRYPQPVPLPDTKCEMCYGLGYVEGGRLGHGDPDTIRERCAVCDGTGWVSHACLGCHEPATTRVWDGFHMQDFCTACAAPDPQDDVISAMLRTLP